MQVGLAPETLQSDATTSAKGQQRTHMLAPGRNRFLRWPAFDPKSPTLVTDAIVTTAAIVTAAVVTAAIITGAIVTAAIAAATARRRRRRHPNSTATAATAAAPTDVVPTAPPITAATPARTPAVPICFGVGRNGGSSEC